MYIFHKNPIQFEIQDIIQYLHYKNVIFFIERNYSLNATFLPSIYYKNRLYIGKYECISLLESYSGITNLLEKANKFK